MEKEDVLCENIKGVIEGLFCRWCCLYLNLRDGENIFFCIYIICVLVIFIVYVKIYVKIRKLFKCRLY